MSVEAYWQALSEITAVYRQASFKVDLVELRLHVKNIAGSHENELTDTERVDLIKKSERFMIRAKKIANR